MNPDLLSLLGNLPGIQQTQGGGAPQPNTGAAPVAQMPNMQAPPPPPPPPTLWERIQQSIMPEPQGAAGLLSKDDLSSARHRGLLDFGLSMLANAHGTGGHNAPSFGQALAGGVNALRQGYSGSLDQTLQNRSTMQSMASQQAITAGRKAIGSFLTQNMTGDQGTDFGALRKAYMMAAAIGDTETMKALSPLLEKGADLGSKPLQAVPAGGDTVLLQPGTTNVAGIVHHTPSPIDPSVLSERQTRLQLALAEAEHRGDARAAAQINAQIAHENSFLDNYRQDPDIKYGTSVAQVAGQIGALAQRSLALDPFAQYQLIEAVLRLRNPEMNRQPNPSDYKALASALGLTGQLRKAFDKYTEGAILPKGAIERLLRTSYNMVAQGKQRYNDARSHYVTRLPAWGLDDTIIPNVFSSVNLPSGDEVHKNPLLEGEP